MAIRFVLMTLLSFAVWALLVWLVGRGRLPCDVSLMVASVSVYVLIDAFFRVLFTLGRNRPVAAEATDDHE